MKRFGGKQILITGGTSGIGLAAAQAFESEGARVVVTGRDRSGVDKAKALLSHDALVMANDSSNLSSARALADELARRNFRLDAVFINAGVARLVPMDAVDETLWDLVFDTNVKGPFFQIQALLPLLNPQSSIVINGSINAHIGMPNTTVYAASKAALISLARTLSAELLPRGVRVNVVSPGPVSTPLYAKLGVDAAALESTAAQIRSQIPLGRFGTPAEIASTVLHLASQESAYIVGTEIISDGGMSQL